MINKISVIIPTCNRPKLLEICIKKILEAIKFSSISVEIIVTEDGTSSSTEFIAWLNNSGVVYLKGPSKGPASNRNNGSAHATGDWLLFIDDDCEPDLYIFSAYLKAIKNNSGCFVFEGCTQAPDKKLEALDYAPENNNGGNLWSCNFLIRKDIFMSLRGFDENFRYAHMEDIDLCDRIKANNFKIVFCKEALVIHPWRKLTSGVKLAKAQEMLYYYNYKNNRHTPIIKLCKDVFFFHLALIRRSVFNLETARAFAMLSVHVSCLFMYHFQWEKTYKIK